MGEGHYYEEYFYSLRGGDKKKKPCILNILDRYIQIGSENAYNLIYYKTVILIIHRA